MPDKTFLHDTAFSRSFLLLWEARDKRQEWKMHCIGKHFKMF